MAVNCNRIVSTMNDCNLLNSALVIHLNIDFQQYFYQLDTTTYKLLRSNGRKSQY